VTPPPGTSVPPRHEEGAGFIAAYPELWGRYLCLDLVNSLETDSRGSGQIFDWLPKPGWRSEFLRSWDLSLDDPKEPVPMAALTELRSVVRPLVEAWGRGSNPDTGNVQTLHTLIGLAPITRELISGSDGYKVEIRPLTRNWNWVLAEIAVSVIQLLNEGKRDRLKVCGNPDCSWLFYDETLNHSRRWCSARACGNLLKVRRFRAQRKGPRTRLGRP
jgi:predicted RNA-binding Zn ribbon-like protein